MKKPIRVATVFSGIGAVEYALKRLHLPHQVVFACDNGGREIEYERETEYATIKALQNASQKCEYVNDLYKSKTRRTNFVEITYKANYKIDNDLFFQDVTLLDGTDFKEKVDLFVGGSPCQSFSSVGFQGGLEDARGTLFYEYARLISEIQPRYFIYENVYNLLKHDKGNTWKVIHEIFETLGYHWKLEVLNAKDFGIPQNRKRLFVVGFKNEADYRLYESPSPTELKFKAQDFLLDEVPLGNFTSQSGDIVLNKAKGAFPEETILTPKVHNYVMATGTKSFFTKPVTDLPIARTILSTMGNHHRAGVDNYYTIPDGRKRRLHQREALRLMGFGDDFITPVSRAQTYKQAGNSIVVDVLISILQGMKLDAVGKEQTNEE